MIWPTKVKWQELERSTKISFIVVILLYTGMAMIGWFKPGASWKDAQVFAWASSHYELGLDVTRGFNLSAEGIESGVQMGDCEVYVMAPPLYHLFLSGVYAVGNQSWQVLRIGPFVYGLIYLYASLALAAKYLKGQARSWLLLFTLSPMILIFSAWNDQLAITLGFAVLAYLCVTNYLETAETKWLAWAGVIYLLGFWNSYIILSILPSVFVHLLLHPGLTWRQRISGISVFFGFVLAGALVSAAHIAQLPDSLQWFVDRIAYRFSNREADTSGGGSISLASFFIREAGRYVTHFSPISILLSLAALGEVILRWVRERGQAARQPQGLQTVGTGALLLVFLSWGLPSQAGIQVAYIHPIMMYYSTVFLAFGSVLGLQWLADKIKQPGTRTLVVRLTVLAFLVFSLTRSVFNLTGGSLSAIVTGVPEKPAKTFGLDELRQYTCRDGR
ncbi:MAG: hypothetical protein ACOY0R_05880 [Chloroflexota bacterium]